MQAEKKGTRKEKKEIRKEKKKIKENWEVKNLRMLSD